MEMRSDKWTRAMAHYNGHKGPATVAHVERNIEAAYPGASKELTGVQYGKLMSVANTSYQDGKHSTTIEEWAYDAPLDWLAGIGKENVIEVNGDTVTITLKANTPDAQKRVYKLTV
jgi:hypothetical protein